MGLHHWSFVPTGDPFFAVEASDLSGRDHHLTRESETLEKVSLHHLVEGVPFRFRTSELVPFRHFCQQELDVNYTFLSARTSEIFL